MMEHETQMILDKISEIKSDNSEEHKEIKEAIKCLPCGLHAERLTKLETINEQKKEKPNSSDDVVTKRVMYIFGGVVTGVAVLIKAIPEIIKALQNIGN